MTPGHETFEEFLRRQSPLERGLPVHPRCKCAHVPVTRSKPMKYALKMAPDHPMRGSRAGKVYATASSGPLGFSFDRLEHAQLFDTVAEAMMKIVERRDGRFKEYGVYIVGVEVESSDPELVEVDRNEPRDGFVIRADRRVQGGPGSVVVDVLWPDESIGRYEHRGFIWGRDVKDGIVFQDLKEVSHAIRARSEAALDKTNRHVGPMCVGDVLRAVPVRRVPGDETRREVPIES